MMPARQPIKVAIDSVNHVGTIEGFHARRLISEAGGRPFWSRRHRHWVTTEKVAVDVIARAEAERIPVELSEVVR